MTPFLHASPPRPTGADLDIDCTRARRLASELAQASMVGPAGLPTFQGGPGTQGLAHAAQAAATMLAGRQSRLCDHLHTLAQTSARWVDHLDATDSAAARSLNEVAR